MSCSVELRVKTVYNLEAVQVILRSMTVSFPCRTYLLLYQKKYLYRGSYMYMSALFY